MIKKFDEYKKPNFKKGDRCVFVYNVGGILSVLNDNVTIESEPYWCEYDKNDQKGYWKYPIVGKVKDYPEEFLRLYTGQKVGDLVEQE